MKENDKRMLEQIVKGDNTREVLAERLLIIDFCNDYLKADIVLKVAKAIDIKLTKSDITRILDNHSQFLDIAYDITIEENEEVERCLFTFLDLAEQILVFNDTLKEYELFTVESTEALCVRRKDIVDYVSNTIIDAMKENIYLHLVQIIKRKGYIE